MTITPYKKKDGKTYYRFDVRLTVDDLTGETRSTSRSGFRTRKEAEIAYLRLKAGEEAIKKQVPTFETIYKHWLEQYKMTVRESTLNKTLGIFENHILPEFGHATVDRIKLAHCQKAVNSWFTTHVNFRVTARYAERVLNYAIKEKYIKENPFTHIVYPVKIDTVEEVEEESINYLEKEELYLVLEEAKKHENPMWFPFFRLMAFSGLRRGEQLALTWSDVDFKNGKISVTKTRTTGLKNKQITQIPKTSKSIRTIDLDQATLKALKLWKVQQTKILVGLGHKIKKDQLVFSSFENKHLVFSIAGHRLDSLTKKTKVTRITPHGLRHTHCYLLFEAGATIKEVMDRMGHSDMRTTMNIYNHVTSKRKQEVANKFAEYVAF